MRLIVSLLLIMTFAVVGCGPKNRSIRETIAEEKAKATAGDIALTVHVKGLRNSDGYVMLSVCADEECNEKKEIDPKRLHSYQIGMAAQTGVTLQLRGFKKGKYAIYLLHDENANRQMDLDPKTSAPLEGFGFSRNVSPLKGPPKFEDIAIDYDGTVQEITICTRYLGEGPSTCEAP